MTVKVGQFFLSGIKASSALCPSERHRLFGVLWCHCIPRNPFLLCCSCAFRLACLLASSIGQADQMHLVKATCPLGKAVTLLVRPGELQLIL